ncbi:thiol-disulfide oxidoreductase DCC family protein [Bizionia sp. KMM 8389]
MLSNLPKNKQLILFDGVCNLCNNAINYVIKHDKNHLFMFAPLESQVGKETIKTYNIDIKKLDSILLFSPDNGISYKSTAALKIAVKLGFPRNLMALFFIVPTFIRDGVYDFIARNRYKWFGKKESCMIPTKELKAKFMN